MLAYPLGMTNAKPDGREILCTPDTPTPAAQKQKKLQLIPQKSLLKKSGERAPDVVGLRTRRDAIPKLATLSRNSYCSANPEY